MRRHLKPAMEGLLQSQPGELFPGNKLPFPSASDAGVHAQTVDQPRAPDDVRMASISLHTNLDDPFSLGLNAPFKVVSPEEAQKDAEYINMMDQIDDAMEAVHALEELAEAIAPEVEVGLSDSALSIVAIASQHMLASVGEEDCSICPAMEDFGKDRVGQTRIVFESLQKKAQKVWKVIVEALQRALIWLKGKARWLLDRSFAQLKVIDALERRAKGMTAPGTIKATFQSNGLVRSLQVGGDFPVDDLVKQAHHTRDVIAVRLKYGYDAGFNEQYGPSAWSNSLNVQKTLDALSGGSTQNNDPRLRLKNTVTVDGAKVHYSDELLGGKVIKEVTGTPESIKEDPLKYALTGAVLAEYVDVAPKATVWLGGALSIPVASLDAIQESLKVAFALAESTHQFRAVLEALEQSAFTMVKQAKEMDEDDHGEAAKMIRKVFSTAPRWLAHEPARIADYSLATAVALTNYAEKSLEFYEKAAQKPAEAQ
jgi:hypothetical protein